MRIMWMSNAEWAGTGYGVQTKYVVPGLESLGHKLAVFPFWGLQGGLIEYQGRPNYPLWGNEWGNDVFMHHAKHFGADIVITLMDSWVLHDDFGKLVKWVAWLPVDHQPCPPAIAERLKTALRPVAYSKFGQLELKKVGIAADYIPHGVNVNIYKPLEVDKGTLKSKLGFPTDCFLIGMIAANKGWPCRKCFPESFEAFGEFVKKHPNARLYCHTEPTNRYAGPDLQGMARSFGIEQFIRFANPYLLSLGYPEETMCEIMNAFDVLLAASMGEGFGVPAIDSQACGVPIITTDCTSMTELTAAGWMVKPSRKWWTPLNSFQFLPHIDGIVDALEAAYQADRKALGKVGREFAMDYRWEKLLQEGWKPLLERLEPFTYKHKD